MSIKVMTYVWEHSRHKGSELLTLLAIADHAHDDGTNAFPSIGLLAQKTRMTERNVQFVLKKLEKSHELTIERNAGPRGCHLFAIPMRGEKISPGEKISGGVKNQTKGVKNPHLLQPQISPEPSLEPSEEPERESPPTPRAPLPDTAASTPKAPSTRRCPPDFLPSNATRQWAADKFPAIDFDDALEAMRDCEFRTAHSDWDATLRTWIRREAKEHPQPRSGRVNPRAPTRYGDPRFSEKSLYNMQATDYLLRKYGVDPDEDTRVTDVSRQLRPGR